MLVLGAKGHAKEVLEILKQKGLNGEIAFYDDVTPEADLDIYLLKYPILRNETEMAQWFTQNDPEFILGVGGVNARHFLWQKAIENGGLSDNLIAHNAYLASDAVSQEGLTAMQMAFISNTVSIGKSVLINARANIHHDVKIGDFCEIGPGALVLGRCKIGSYTFIGAGAIILPDIEIGNHCVVGAGAVVTRRVSDFNMVKGNPAK